MEELHEADEVISVFRKLADDPRLEPTWSHLRRYIQITEPTITRFLSRLPLSDLPRGSPNSSEKWCRTGLPVTQADMLRFVSTAVPPHLAGRKWYASVISLTDAIVERFLSLCQSCISQHWQASSAGRLGE
jgi:hypothetical protein